MKRHPKKRHIRTILYTLVLSTALIFVTPRNAHAIVVIPALILIPIAKIIAVFIAGLSFPAAFMGAISAKLSGKPWLKGVVIAIVVLLVVALIVGVTLKIVNPSRPLS